MRVAVVFDNFGAYHIARLAAAASEMNILAVEVTSKSAEYEWQAPSIPDNLEYVRLLDIADAGSKAVLSERYAQRVAHWKPDAIALPGWSSSAALAGAKWAAGKGISAILMSESNAADVARNSLSELTKRKIVSFFQAGLCGGSLARSYLIELGLSRDRIFVGYDVVDNGYFAKGAAQVRSANSMPGSIDPRWWRQYFLAIARFVPKKNLINLIDAYARYRAAAGPAAWPLVILGDGPLRGDLEGRRAELGLEASVVMPGFKQYDELPLYYGSAGVYVQASTTEQWGLVVNEAMASGLPVLVSNRCGCTPDLVEVGHNGYTFDPNNLDVLARKMLEMASEGCNLAAMGNASTSIIANWSPHTFAVGLRKAAQAALDAPLRRPGLLGKTLLWALMRR